MAGKIGSFFASLGFKADYKELDNFERRLKQLQRDHGKTSVGTGMGVSGNPRVARKNARELARINKTYRRQEIKTLEGIRRDRQKLAAEQTQELDKINKNTKLSEQQRRDALIDTQQKYVDAQRRIDREEAAIHEKRIAEAKKRAERTKRDAEIERNRIQRRGRLEAQAYAEDESRKQRAHKAELRRIREEEMARKRARRRMKRNVGIGLGVAAGAGLGGAMSVQSYQQSLGIDRGLTAATGSQEMGQQERQTLNALADKYGIFIGDAGQSYASMLASSRGTKLEGAGATQAFESILAQSRVMNLSTADTQGVLRAMGQIINKGTVMSEEMKSQLG